MSNQPNPLSLPTRQPPRTDSLTIRLSAEESTAISTLAKRLQVPISQMARHFLLQAVNHYIQRMQVDVSDPRNAPEGKA